jgi:flagellar protein FliL
MAKGAIIGAVIGTLAAGGGGFAFGFLGIVKSPAPAPAHEAPAAPSKTPPPKPAEVRPLTTIIANLRDPPDLHVRLEVVVVMEPATLEAAAIAAKVGDDIVAYLRTVSLSEIEGPTGYQYFRDDLRKRAVQIGGGKVKELLLQSFVVQ